MITSKKSYYNSYNVTITHKNVFVIIITLRLHYDYMNDFKGLTNEWWENPQENSVLFKLITRNDWGR